MSPPCSLLSHGHSQPELSLLHLYALVSSSGMCWQAVLSPGLPDIIPTLSLPGSFREAPQSRLLRLTHLGAHSNGLTYLEPGCPPQLLAVSSFLLQHCPHPQLCSPSQGQGSLLQGLCLAVGLGPRNQLPCPSWPCLAPWSARTQVLASLWPLLPHRSSASVHWLLWG